MALKLITAPATEPVTLAEAKAHLRVDDSGSDTLIGVLIQAAREMAEQETGRALLPQTWEKTLDNFPTAIELTNAPIISITTVKYYDLAGVEQTLASPSYKLDAAGDFSKAWLVPAYGYAWPSTLEDINVVKVRYVAGYADAASVPASIKQWMLLQVGHWFENREAAAENKLEPLPFADGLLDRYRIYAL